jgi:hypothetical protein
MGKTRMAWIGVAVAMTIAVLPASPASAGGSWFDLDDPYYVVGEPVSTIAHFGSGAYAPVSAGPWFAWLRPDRSAGRSDEPSVERAGPFFLGPVSIRQGVYGPWVAELSFQIPAVPTGTYFMEVCNEGCRDGVGDLVGGYLFIVQSRQEVKPLARQSIKLRAWLDGANERADEASRSLVRAERANAARADRIRHLESALAAADRSAPDGGIQAATIAWLASAFAAGFAVAVVAGGRRRRGGGFVVPDSPAGIDLEPDRARR